MDFVINSFRILTTLRVSVMVLVIFLVTGCSFTDNATNLAYKLEAASKALKNEKNGSEYIIHYKSKDSKSSFIILLLSKNGITSEELLEKGLDPKIVNDLYPQLSYIDLKKSATLIVYQNGKISFTTYYRQFVDVSETQIINGVGKIDIVVKKVGIGPGHIAKEVIIIELNKRID